MTEHTRESLSQAAESVAAVVRHAADADLTSLTPCTEFDLKALINHFTGTTAALTRVGRRQDLDAQDPYGSQQDHTSGDWVGTLTDNLQALSKVWSDPNAWEGSVDMGGGEMPAVLIGDMVFAEIVLHGWDLAQATGQSLTLDASAAAELRRGIEETAEMGRQMGAYGSEVVVGEDASDFERALAAAGRSMHRSAVNGQ